MLQNEIKKILWILVTRSTIKMLNILEKKRRKRICIYNVQNQFCENEFITWNIKLTIYVLGFLSKFIHMFQKIFSMFTVLDHITLINHILRILIIYYKISKDIFI